MPTKKRGSGITDLTVEILKDIREELREIKKATDETNQRLGRLEQRFDHLLEFAGDRYREHEERIRILEKHAGLRSA